MFTTSLDNILSSLTDLTTKLDKFIESTDTEVDSLTKKSDELAFKAKAKFSDGVRARQVKNNINKLLEA